MADINKLKSNSLNCPFCGLFNLDVQFNKTRTKMYVKCCKCGASGPLEKNVEDAFESWNKRYNNLKKQ